MASPASSSPVLDVRDLLGIRWGLGGRDVRPGGLVDCLGISLHVVGKILGIPVRDPWRVIAREWQDLCLPEDLRERADEVAANYLGPGWHQGNPPYRIGDLVETDGGSHVAACIGGGWFISANRVCGVYLFPEDTRRETLGTVWRWSC